MDLIFALLLAANVSTVHAAPSKPIHRPSIVRVVKPRMLVTSKQLHRMNEDTNDADDTEDLYLPSAEIVAKPRKPEERSDNVKKRLAAARLLALAKHREVWGLTHANQACYSS